MGQRAEYLVVCTEDDLVTQTVTAAGKGECMGIIFITEGQR